MIASTLVLGRAPARVPALAWLPVEAAGADRRRRLAGTALANPAGGLPPRRVLAPAGSLALRVGAGALGYLDFAALAEAGIGVQVATYSHPPYSRGRQPFIPGLSALDLLLHQGPGGIHILSRGGQLTTWTGSIPA